MRNSVNPILVAGGADRLPEGCCVLAIISKAPQAGEVKTRLVPPLTPEQAAELHAAFLKDMAASIGACAKLRLAKKTDGGGLSLIQGAVVYTPIGTERIFDGLLPAGFVLLAQGEGDLGERLSKAADDLLSLGASSVCLLNSDSPTLPIAALEQAVLRLSAPGDRVVLGPAEDGGYYLVGVKRAHRRLFERITWSTDVVLAQTVVRAAEIGLPVELLAPWFDVDDEEGLRRLMQPAVDHGAHGATEAAHTRRVLAKFYAAGDRAEWANERAAEAEVA